VRSKLGLMAATAVLALSAGAATAQDKKTLAIVVKGLDNPFFEQINLGCQKWMSENTDSEYECLYTGPASSADEAGEVQIVDDLLTSGVAAIAISPSNAPAMANRVRDRADRAGDDDRRGFLEQDRDLRKTYLGTDNYLMGVKMAEEAMKLKPEGGTVCLQLGNVAADNINARAAGLPRHRGREGHRAPDRPERLDRDRRLPGLHQRPGRSRQPADGGHLHRQPRPRRLHPDRRLGAVRARRPMRR
jgi:ribose transport system substrate-binding protein